LIDKIGKDAVEWLIKNQRSKKVYTRLELNEIIEKYKLKP